jgi:toxin secretion/phage lysis holin
MILVLVMIGVLLDQAMGTEYIRMMVVIFFIGNEGISLLENLGLMGVPYPEFLRKALEALHEQGNQGKKSE